MTALLWVALLLSVAVSNIHTQSFDDLPPIKYSHRVVLDQDNAYVMLWTPHDDVIEIEVQVETKGYVGLGFSPNGGMKGADIVLGWVDAAGKVFLQDRYAEGNWAPTVDESQDVKLLGGYQNDTHTVLRFTRPWRTLDTAKDFMLGEDTVRVIWAYSSSDPTSKMDLQYHEARGTKSLYLQSPQFQLPPMGPDVKTLDLISRNMSIPDNLDTLYWCKMFKIPVTTKHHIIGYIPLLQKENLEHVHHMVLHECNTQVVDHHHYEKWLDWEGTQCYSPNMPPSWKFCSSLFAWAVGGEGEMFPEHVGFPVGENGLESYFLLEMHYDNPDYRQGVVDSSGIRLFYTDTLREYDAGTIAFGHDTTPYHIIPPHQKWQSSGYCDPSCTKQHLPPGGLKLFQGLLHSHLLGSTFVLRHGRNGQELPPILKDMNYDFNYQNTRILREEVTILPGDALVVDCGYNTSHRSTPTYGGLGTNEEMCIAFMSYYPRIDLSYCLSQPTADTILSGLGIEVDTTKEVDKILSDQYNKPDLEKESQFLQKVMSGNFSNEATPMIVAHLLTFINVTAPQKYFNRSLYSILQDSATWRDERVAAALQKAVLEGNHSSTCYLRSDAGSWKSEVIVTDPILKPLPESLPAVSFRHSIVLDQQGSYVMLWTPRKEDIVFEVQVGTKGYIGLGFSPTGGMKGADIVLGWVDDADGKVFLHDRFAEGNMAPKVDESQDVKLLGGYQNDTHTVLRFSRPWNTCDEEQDYILSDDTVQIIWAYSRSDPASETSLHYHDRRGSKSLHLQAPQFELPPMGPDVKTWDFLSPNVSLPDHLDTLYWCKLYKMPPTPAKSHMIGYIPVIEGKNAEHVHHLLFYECRAPNGDVDFEQWLDWEGTRCYSANMPTSWKYCKSVIIGWAVGGEGEIFPEHTGFPIGEEHGGATYFLMETHYDNPNLRQGVVDSSGIRIFYTEKLREQEAALLMLGHHVTYSHIIPPRQQRFLSGSFCDTSCTKESFPRDGVKIFAGVLHTHLLGTSVVVRHIRNGQELPVILKDLNYDFNYQSTRVLKEEVKVLPGDILITECYYDSSNKSDPTFGGFSTQEEMCLAFLSYYPRVNLSGCLSQPQFKDTLTPLGVKNITFDKPVKSRANDNQSEAKVDSMRRNKVGQPRRNSDSYHSMRITAPEKFLNMSLFDLLYNETTWLDPTMVDSFQRLATSGVHMVSCGRDNIKRRVSYPSFRPRRPEPNKCLQGGNAWAGNNLCPSAFPFCSNSKTRDTFF